MQWDGDGTTIKPQSRCRLSSVSIQQHDAPSSCPHKWDQLSRGSEWGACMQAGAEITGFFAKCGRDREVGTGGLQLRQTVARVPGGHA